MRVKYFRAKRNFYEYYIGELKTKFTNQEIFQGLHLHKQTDELKERRAEFMYSYLDYDNDRSIVRDRFVKEMNKKTTLKDIAETLDKLILDEKAEGAEYYNPATDYTPSTLKKDVTSYDLSWSGVLANS
jgi:hypothetical protein